MFTGLACSSCAVEVAAGTSGGRGLNAPNAHATTAASAAIPSTPIAVIQLRSMVHLLRLSLGQSISRSHGREPFLRRRAVTGVVVWCLVILVPCGDRPTR